MEKEKKSTTSTKKRILSFLAALLMALACCLPWSSIPYMVEAAQIQVHPYLVAYGSSYGSAFVSRPIGVFNKSHSNGWRIYVDLPSGRTTAYCLGYGQPLSRYNWITQDSTFANLSKSQQDKIQRAIILGYNDTTAVTKGLGQWDYAATQIAVWLIQGGYFNTGNESWMVDTLSEIGGAAKSTVSQKYYELKNKILYATATPSFASTNSSNVPTYKLTWNNSAGQYMTTLTNTTYADQGLVYNYMEFSIGDYTNFDYSPDANNRNILTISTRNGASSRGIAAGTSFTANNTVSRMLATGTATGIVDGSVESWSASGKQPTCTFGAGRSDPVPSYFNVEIDSGILTIWKEFEDSNGDKITSGVDKGNVQVQIVGQNTGYTATYVTDGNGLIRQWVPSDTYTITEINTGSQWVQPAAQTATVSTGNETTVTITNKEKIWTLTVNKEIEGTNYMTGGVSFSVYKDGELQTSTSGKTVFEESQIGVVEIGPFPCGTGYVLKEVTSPYGVTFDPNKEWPISGTDGSSSNSPSIHLSMTVTNPPGKWNLTVYKEDANTGNRLAGAKFSVYDNDGVVTDSNNQSVFTTDSNGSFTTGDFTYDLGQTYYLQEIEAPPGTDAYGNSYLLDTTKHEITGIRKQNQTTSVPVTMTVTDVPEFEWELDLLKCNADYSYNISNFTATRPLANVSFTLYRASDDQVIDTYITDENGKLKITGMTTSPDGYYLVEDVPTGFGWIGRIDLEGTDGSYDLEDGRTVKYTYSTTAEGTTKLSIQMIVPNEPAADGVQIHKVSQTSEAIEGITFGVFNSRNLSGSASTPSGNVESMVDNGDGSYTITIYDGRNRVTSTATPGAIITTDSAGNAAFDVNEVASNLGFGTPSTGSTASTQYITIIELNAPDNVIMSTTLFTTRITYSYHGGYARYWAADTTEFTITNTVTNGSVSGIKYGYTSATSPAIPLENVEFGLFDGSLSDEEMVRGAEIDSYRTGSNGAYEFTGLKAGSYAIKELSGDGEREPSDEVYRFQITRTNATAHFTHNFYNYHKCEVTGIKYGVDHEGNRTPLAGATFGLFGIGTSEFTTDTALQVVTSGSDGTFRFTAVTSNGNFQIVELEAPVGYEKSNEIHTVQTRNGFIYMVDGQLYQDGTAHTVNFEFENPLKPAYIEGLKTGTDYTGTTNPLANVVIGLFDANETSYTSAHALQTITTNSDGLFRFDNLNPNGNYKVVELSVDQPWIKSDTVFSVTFYDGRVQQLSGNGAVVGEDGHSVYITIDNPQPTVWVEGIKYGISADNTRNPLAGATIGIFESSVTEYTVDNALQTVVSESNGSFRFDSLDPNGNFKIVELEAPVGFEKSDTILTARFENGKAVGDGSNEDHFEFEIENYEYKADLRIIKADENGDFLDGATFGLFARNAAEYTSANAIQTAVTSNGQCVFQNVSYGDYAVVELSGVDGHMMDATPQYVTVNATTDDQTIELHFTNPTAPYSIQGHKVDEHGTALEGALFGLYWANQNYGSYTDQNAIMTAESGSDGVFSFSPVGIGNYVVVELAAPVDTNGVEYELDQTPHPVSVTSSSSAVVEIGNIVNIPITNRIWGHKVDGATGEILANAVFGLYDVTDTDFSNPLQTAVANEQGVFEFPAVYLGSYVVREISSGNEDYEVNPTAYPANVSQANVEIYIGSVPNYRLGTIYGTKVSTDGTTIAGAKFGLYTSQQTNPTESGTNLIAISDKTGAFSFSDLALDTTYYLYELEAPANHQKIEGLIWSGTVTATTPAVNVGEIVNTPNITTITGTKLDGDTNNPLAGATIGLYDSSKVTSWQQANRDNALMLITTLEDGVFTFSGTMDEFAASMVIYEIESPANYQVITDPLWTGNLGDTPQTIYVGNIYNYPSTFNLDGVKVDQNNAPLSGAVFGLFDSADVDSRTDVTEDNALQTYTTGSDGAFSFSDISFNGETAYEVYEIKAPEGRQLIENAVWTGTPDSAQTIHIGNVVNLPLTFNLDGVKVDQNNAPLSGAVFGLFNAADVDNRADVTEENALQTYTTESDGSFSFTNITCDSSVTFAVYEIKAPEGRQLIENAVWTGTSETAQTIHIGNVINYPDTFDLTGTKINSNHEELSGAVFGIYDASKVTSWDQATTENAIMTAESGSDGVFVFEDLSCSGTNLVVYELVAPEGYDLLKDAIWTGTNTDGSTINVGYIVNYTHNELPGTGGSGQDPIIPAMALGLFACSAIGFGLVICLTTRNKKRGDV